MFCSTDSSPFHTMSDEMMVVPQSTQIGSIDESLRMSETQLSSSQEATYACMKPAYEQPDPSTQTEELTLNMWTNLYPENWTPNLVQDWLLCIVAYRKELVEKFQDINGRDLCSMSREDLISLSPDCGQYIYDQLQQLISVNFQEPDMFFQDIPDENICNAADQSLSALNSTSAVLEMNRCPTWDDCSDPFGLRYDILPGTPSARQAQHDDGYGTEHSESDRDSYYSDYQPHTQQQVQHNQLANWLETMHYTCPAAEQNQSKPRRRRPAKSLTSSSSDDEGYSSPRSPRNHRGRQSSNGSRLWEFVRDLLKNPEHIDKLVKWEDRKAGVFRFLHSADVARLWGTKKKNEGMTYEKMSRAMRYYYKSEILEQVPGKRLVYKFGKNATGWRE